MRKGPGLLVVVAAVAVGAGLALPASAVKVGSTALSEASFNDELAAITASPPYECFLEARVFTASQFQSQGPKAGGVSSQTNSSSAAVLWGDQRVTELAVTSFVEAHDPQAFSPTALTIARGALDQSIYRKLGQAFSAQATTPFSCPAAVIGGSTPRLESGAAILATLPAWFQDVLVRVEAADLGLIALLPNKIPESGTALQSWYARHGSMFDTTCVSVIALPSLTAASSIESKIAAGLSFANAAKRYSRDAPSNKKGGALGCFSPNSAIWSQVVQYVGSTPTRKISLWPIRGAYFLFSPTKRTSNSFAQVAAAVTTEVHLANVQNAEIFAATIAQAAPVAVSSWLGTWGPNQIGGQILANPAPPGAAVVNPSANTPTG